MKNHRLAAIALVSGGLLAAPQAAQAQGLLDLGRIVLGLPTEQKDPIDYRERAPLVVPPNQQSLRPPQEAIPPDQRRANWPQDPDVLERRRAAERASKPVMVDSVTGREMPVRRMTLDEIRAGRISGAEVPQRGEVARAPLDFRNPAGNVIDGVQGLREMDRRDAASGANSGNLSRAEPRREFLTDPPGGLRQPAANAAFRATREGQVGPREEPKPYDIYREGPNTR